MWISGPISQEVPTRPTTQTPKSFSDQGSVSPRPAKKEKGLHPHSQEGEELREGRDLLSVEFDTVECHNYFSKETQPKETLDSSSYFPVVSQFSLISSSNCLQLFFISTQENLMMQPGLRLGYLRVQGSNVAHEWNPYQPLSHCMDKRLHVHTLGNEVLTATKVTSCLCSALVWAPQWPRHHFTVK